MSSSADFSEVFQILCITYNYVAYIMRKVFLTELLLATVSTSTKVHGSNTSTVLYWESSAGQNFEQLDCSDIFYL